MHDSTATQLPSTDTLSTSSYHLLHIPLYIAHPCHKLLYSTADQSMQYVFQERNESSDDPDPHTSASFSRAVKRALAGVDRMVLQLCS